MIGIDNAACDATTAPSAGITGHLRVIQGGCAFDIKDATTGEAKPAAPTIQPTQEMPKAQGLE